MSFVTRFAPSPTGFLHLGHAFSAFQAWRRARKHSGRFILRLEDIDTTRCQPEFATAIQEDLIWLGLDWDGDVRIQSAHLAEYRLALDRLDAACLLYPCFCSRRQIAAAQSAPHGAEPVYPGTCRGLSQAERTDRIAAGEPFALRLDIAGASRITGLLRFHDEAAGWTTADPIRFGDVILARRDVPTSYHLCVVHDDALQGVTHVIRGEDLRGATHIHAVLQSLLGLPSPAYCFHRLLTDETGKRLAKRDRAMTLRAMREAGIAPASIREKLTRQCEAV